MPSCDQRDCGDCLSTIYIDSLTGRRISKRKLKEIRKSRKNFGIRRKGFEKEKKKRIIRKKERKAKEIKGMTAKLKKIKRKLAQLKLTQLKKEED